jgi:hypothetical protein
MKSHISSSSTHLWRVIQNGFAPHDPLNLTKREEVDEQLNVTAKHLLQQAMSDTHAAHINNLSTAKEVWDYLTMLFIGNESIRSSKFDELKVKRGISLCEIMRLLMRCTNGSWLLQWP